ncbi:nitrous oxide reductase accessory protein NosL [Haloarchaeobius sp. HRN-SO-5]|uniref:nitrous oxide reductase accessory protein NosL n=1 Tax=Haloarchaeobius sp. HRN-SO-5 TaxID=3446118 RepID=UPI003EB7D768
MCNHCVPDDEQRVESDRGLSRRAVLGAGAAMTATALAGCLGGEGDGEAPAAVAIGEQDACDVCGMVISKHPGPNGQVYWRDNEPEEHDPPFRFDSLKQCLFPHVFEMRDQGWTAEAIYVTDYSSVEYDVSTSDGTPRISSHTEASSFGPARDLYYVVESDVQGAMGPDFVPFSNRDDADSFAAEYGGSVVEFGDVTPALVGR